MDNNFNNETFNYTPQPEQPQKDPGHGLAIASLVLGILSILSCCCTYLAIILGVVGIVLAIISKSKSLAGKMETMATVGMILSILGVVIAVGMIIWSAAFAQSPAYQEIMNQYMDMYGSY
ncbi:MAG: DUF4190 domain-containing protein [Lachnospiraceae bacterium]|nr:DUF4190 domain-containing protein [Lachnospiraceae bacterium]